MIMAYEMNLQVLHWELAGYMYFNNELLCDRQQSLWAITIIIIATATST